MQIKVTIDNASVLTSDRMELTLPADYADIVGMFGTDKLEICKCDAPFTVFPSDNLEALNEIAKLDYHSTVQVAFLVGEGFSLSYAYKYRNDVFFKPDKSLSDLINAELNSVGGSRQAIHDRLTAEGYEQTDEGLIKYKKAV